ncbi:RNB-domain-containing protein [Choiromyces venosus 120613-1]|uniref:RNB-domain-containing protein n=1 Tax=Choiromyces venosus 120613-1 TaxID=1336337 RepID=A0A3N4KAT5_9PEZI|nr:RNB-domain-containing protein [Choiromyces venosus 120613-1]
MPLPNILRTQTPVLVSLLRRSIKPHVLIAGSSRRTFLNSFTKHNSTAANSTPTPNFLESEEPLPLLSDVTSNFDESPTPPEKSAGERGDDAPSGDAVTRPPRLRKVSIEHRPRRSIFRTVFLRGPPRIRRLNVGPGDLAPGLQPLAWEERQVANAKVRKVATEGGAQIERVHRIPVSSIEEDVGPTCTKLEGLLLQISEPQEFGKYISRAVYISPEDMVKEWNFWKYRDQNIMQESPLTREYGIEMTKNVARELHNYWRMQEVLQGQDTPELEFVRSLVRGTQRAHVNSLPIPKDTVESLRYSSNVRRIVSSWEDEDIVLETWLGPERKLPRIDALAETINMGQKLIFQIEKYIDHIAGRGTVAQNGTPNGSAHYASFMMRNAILCSERNDVNVKVYLDAPRDQDLIEYASINKTYHLPRAEALHRICQGFGSFLGLADLGIMHLIRKKEDRYQFTWEAYEKLLERLRLNTESLLDTPIEGGCEGTSIPFLGRHKKSRQRYTRINMVERIAQQQYRAFVLATECLSLAQPKGSIIRPIKTNPEPMHPFPSYRIIQFGGVRKYSTMTPRPPSSSVPGMPMGPPQITRSKIDSIRKRFEVMEANKRKALDGVRPNTVMKDLVVEVVPSVDSTDDTLGHNWEGLGDMSDLSDASSAKPLEIGDLSEVRTGNQAELGLYLRPTPGGEPTSDFLMTSGNIVQRQLPRISFSIPGFVLKAQVESFISYYDQMIEKMSDIYGPEVDLDDIAAPRSVTGAILDPARQFGATAARLYADNRAAFDGLYVKWADETEERKITLFEAAEMAFGADCNQDPNYQTMLYAVHTALMGDGLHFMADRGMHRATNVFRVRSKKDIRMIDSVTRLIRSTAVEQQTTDASGKMTAEGTGRKIMAKFIEKANYLIDLSREYEKEVKTGRKKGAPLVETVDIKELKWDENDKFFIEYVKARVLKYGLQKTPIDGLAPVILRATNRYGEVLDALTADTFLREIGAWSKWENTSLHQSGLDLPGLGRSELGDEDHKRFQLLNQKDSIKKLDLKDVMHDVRKDWGDMEVFTIDDPDAHEIDDGVSLERVSDTENWVHVHIANPTAYIAEDHWIAEIAKRRATAHYLPDKVYSMLPEAITGPFLGVAPNRPVMSISIKVNDRGEILDYKIQAGFVRNVRRTTYDAVDLALGSYKTIEFHADLTIGKFPKSQRVRREAKKFTPKQLRDLQKLRDIALAVRRRRTKDGLIVASSMDLQVKVYNDLGSRNHPYNSNYPVLYRGHPAVNMTVSDSLDIETRDSQLMVSEMMSLANNVASIWSRERKLAMPYRVMEYDYRRPDVVKAIEQTVLPLRTDLGRPPFESTIRWLMLLGQTRLQATPGPHMLMGLPTGYTKATSPLRRYSDMLAQYQIQSVLLKTPPKSVSQLDPILATLQRTEQTAKHVSKEATRLWSAVAIKRAWETGLENYTFPKKLSFLVMEKHSFPTPCNGLVRELGLVGKMGLEKRIEDRVQVGDVVDVEICDVKLSERYVWFRFLGGVERGGVRL